MEESQNLELKQEYTRSFLKTVSAFANYLDGEVIFGICDDGSLSKISNPKETAERIENAINDNIVPTPQFTITINNNSTITLKVYKGLHTPYLFKNRAYNRNHTSTVQANRLELNRLILKGQNKNYEELESDIQNSQFKILESKMRSLVGLEKIDNNALISLQLKTGDIYNNAASLFSDTNNNQGIDIAEFGDNINEIRNRTTLPGQSILNQYDKALSIFEDKYVYEKITKSNRVEIETIPTEAFREVIANSLVHRAWDIDANINVSMFSDKIEVTSPGGLPEGMSETEFMNGGISIIRNRITANIFYRLKLIEHFGTGIKRIKESYSKSLNQPIFYVFPNSIKIILPVIIDKSNISEIQKHIVELLEKQKLSSSQISHEIGLGKTKTVEIINELTRKNILIKTGKGKSTKYSRH